MFSKLFTPPKQPRKAQLSDFLKPASSFFGDITPPSSPAQTFVERVSFTPSPLATTAHHSEEFSTNENEQTAHPSNCSCCPTCTREPEGNSNPKKHGPTTFSQLRSRFQDRQYSVNLIYTQTGHGRRGKDCTCGNQGCKLRFQSQIGLVDRIQDGLLANWGPSASRSDRKNNLYVDLLVGKQLNEATGKLEQNWIIDGQPVCYNFYLAARGYTHEFVRRRRNLMEKNGSTIGSINDYMEATQRQSTQPKKEHFLAWLRNYAHTVGDHMPDENATVLPYGKFEGVWSEYKVEMDRRNEEWCCYSYACRIFNEEVPDIRLVRHKGAFVCCKICTSYQM